MAKRKTTTAKPPPRRRRSVGGLRANELEDLVGKLEALLHGSGAQIRVRDHIRGRSGAEREVDVSVRMAAGSVSVLVIFECRGHRRVQDVMWIEQLAAKKQTLEASAIVGVSSSGFSSDAIATAAVHGVELRTIATIDVRAFQTWLPGALKAHFIRMTLQVLQTRASFPKDLLTMPAYQTLTYEDRVLAVPGDAQLRSIIDIVEDAKESLVEGVDRPIPDRPLTPQRREFTIGELELHLAGVVWPVRGLTIAVEISATTAPLRMESAHSYQSPGIAQPHVARATLSVDDMPEVPAAHISVIPSRRLIALELEVRGEKGTAPFPA